MESLSETKSVYFSELSKEDNRFYGCYNLEKDKIKQIANSLALEHANLDLLYKQNGVQILLVDGSDPSNPYSSLARTLECDFFPEIPMILKPYEENSSFMFLIDYGSPPDVKNGQLAHVFRLLHYSPSPSGLTGLEVIDKLSDQLTLEEIVEYHKICDLNACYNVSSNFAVPGANPSRSRPFGLIMYRALFELVKQTGATDVFTELNPVAIKSLARLGVNFDRICGRSDLIIPQVDEFTFDEYVSVCINYDRNKEVLQSPEFARRKGVLATLINKWHIRIEVINE